MRVFLVISLAAIISVNPLPEDSNNWDEESLDDLSDVATDPELPSYSSEIPCTSETFTDNPFFDNIQERDGIACPVKVQSNSNSDDKPLLVPKPIRKLPVPEKPDTELVPEQPIESPAGTSTRPRPQKLTPEERAQKVGRPVLKQDSPNANNPCIGSGNRKVRRRTHLSCAGPEFLEWGMVDTDSKVVWNCLEGEFSKTLAMINICSTSDVSNSSRLAFECASSQKATCSKRNGGILLPDIYFQGKLSIFSREST